MTDSFTRVADLNDEIAALRKFARRHDEILEQKRRAMPQPDTAFTATPFDPDCLRDIPTRQEEFLLLAQSDPEEAAVRHGIREIGLRLCAIGGVDLMRAVLDDIDDGSCIAIVDSMWAGIGHNVAGYWWT
jgi:hypothetical protein